MAILHNIKIKNFRGIQNFEQNFDSGLICIIGRGDSGKSTILEAINLVLSSSWTMSFHDSDFYNCQTDTPIEIEATLTNIPEKQLAKYGMFVRGIIAGSIIDDIESEEAINAKEALTIKLTVTKDLEPIWTVVSYRGQEPTIITATDRAKMNVSSISDYIDRHFSLNKGNPLYTLFKSLNENNIDENEGNVVLDILRETKTRIDDSIADKFDSVIKKIIDTATALGIDTDGIRASIDHRDISIKENKVCLHESEIPLRLKGKGARRLFSLAIQLSIANPNGIILIDEIEQGLEPDRVQHLVSILSKITNSQIIFTTHSRNVIVELSCNNLFLMTKDATSLLNIPLELQDCVRSNPEALFMKRIIVCEGKTEIGICRALNQYRQSLDKINLAYLGIGLVDGGGDSMIERATKFSSLGFSTSLLCDSDKDMADAKNMLRGAGISVFDCQAGSSIEQQLFADLSWEQIVQLVDYKIQIEDFDSKAVFQSTYSQKQPMPDFTENWYKVESDELRILLGNASKRKNGWYKRIDHAEKVGEIIFSDFDKLPADKKTKQMFEELSQWIDS